MTMTESAIRLLILILIFVSVVLLMERGLSWYRLNRVGGRAINERLRLIARGFDRTAVLSRLRRDSTSGAIFLPGFLANTGRKLDNMLRGAGLGLTPARVVTMLVAAAAVIFLVTLIAAVVAGFTITFGTMVMIGCFAGAGGLGIPLMVLARRADRRHKKLQEQFPVALDIFVRGLRAGHPVATALDLLTQEMADPIGSEFGIVTDEVTYGAELRDALQNMADRCDLDDLRMFVVSLSVQNETGGNLAEILENLSKVIRERASMMLMVRALSSEGRMTATILTILPVGAFVVLFLLNPPFYLDVAGDPAFIIGFGCLIALYTVGFLIIRRLVDLKV
jgi:tight adherence protein B